MKLHYTYQTVNHNIQLYAGEQAFRIANSDIGLPLGVMHGGTSINNIYQLMNHGWSPACMTHEYDKRIQYSGGHGYTAEMLRGKK